MIQRGSISAVLSSVILGMTLVLVSACGGQKKEPAPVQENSHIAAAVEAMADNWDGEIQFVTNFNALDPSLAPADAAGDSRVASVFDPNDDYWGLPRDEGVEYVASFCAACHSLQIVMQQRRSEERWHELLDWMIDTQGMVAPPDDIRQDIEAYLGRNFGENSP